MRASVYLPAKTADCYFKDRTRQCVQSDESHQWLESCGPHKLCDLVLCVPRACPMLALRLEGLVDAKAKLSPPARSAKLSRFSMPSGCIQKKIRRFFLNDWMKCEER